MKLQLTDIPDSHKNGRKIHDWEKQNIAACRKRMVEESYLKDGALHWKSNDSPIPPHVFRENFVEMPQTQQAVYDQRTSEILTQYREYREEHGYSGEELAEMRAAFGPGETVVNVVTGQRIEL